MLRLDMFHCLVRFIYFLSSNFNTFCVFLFTVQVAYVNGIINEYVDYRPIKATARFLRLGG